MRKVLWMGGEDVKGMIVAAAVLCAGPAIAQSGEECVDLEDPVARLDCFDRAFGIDDQVETEAPSGVGKWVVETEVSPIDDSTTVFLSLASDDEIEGPYGQPGPFLLNLRCLENKTAAFIYFNEHFMSSLQGGGRVEYRLDDQDARSVNMEDSNNHMALGLWSGSRAIPWIKELIGAERLVIRATPMSAGTYTARFDLRGLDEAVTGLREQCGW